MITPCKTIHLMNRPEDPKHDLSTAAMFCDRHPLAWKLQMLTAQLDWTIESVARIKEDWTRTAQQMSDLAHAEKADPKEENKEDK